MPLPSLTRKTKKQILLSSQAPYPRKTSIIVVLATKRNRFFFSSFCRKKKYCIFAPEQEFYKRFKTNKHREYKVTTDLLSPLADVKADICNLPFAANDFDILFCKIRMFQNIFQNDTKVMQEL
jgi:hypothetical protein